MADCYIEAAESQRLAVCPAIRRANYSDSKVRLHRRVQNV